MHYILVDTANLFFKSRHIASKRSTDWERVGFSIHLTLAGVNSIIKKIGVSEYHVVFCLEGRSWRKDFYKPYKANREIAKQALTEQELEQDKMFWDTYSEFTQFISNKTNVSVLRCEIAEADDLIGRFIALHPEDNHVILSSDSDFIQLVDKNVNQYNSLSGYFITPDGVFDDRNRKLEFSIASNSKLKVGKPKEDFVVATDWTKYALFLKCMRGDRGDNVFCAYPGVREKGTKTKVGLKEAYDDRIKKGFSWNNMMLQRWVDHDGMEHRVLDDYERNRTLIDLTAQPESIKTKIDQQITEQLSTKEHIGNVGIHFLKFCGKYELEKLSELANAYSKWLNTSYTGVHK
jgi:5'-3' exonuclease